MNPVLAGVIGWAVGLGIALGLWAILPDLGDTADLLLGAGFGLAGFAAGVAWLGDPYA